MEDIFKTLKDMPFDINEHNPSLRKHGIGFPHTEETKKLLSEMKKGQKQSKEHINNRVKSTIGFKQTEYQKERARETFSCTWLVTHPNGMSMNIVNLRKFCKENGLDQGNMVKVSQGILKQHKGWTCAKIA
jgi:hypothetical protein